MTDAPASSQAFAHWTARWGRVLAWVLLALSGCLLLAPNLAPLVTGHRLVVVDGGSMEPTMYRGDVVLTAPPVGDDLQVGNVVVVGAPPAGYTHRVIETTGEGTDKRARLQGDANDVADPHWVSQTDVTAVPVWSLSGVPAVFVRSALQPPGSLVITALLVVALVFLLSASGARTDARSDS